MFTPKGMELERGWPGRIDGDVIVQLAAQTLQAFFTGGGGAREHATYLARDCDLRAPVLYPPAVRVFGSPAGSSSPFFEFRSPFPVLGPEDELPYPEGTADLVLGPGIAAVIGADGAVGGYTLANLWTARDLAGAERAAGFGLSKSSDFGFSLGPVLVTPDEEIDGELVARVDGREQTVGGLADALAAWPGLVAHAALNTTLRPGDILVVALPAGEQPALARGSVVELEAGGIGVLKNRIA